MTPNQRRLALSRPVIQSDYNIMLFLSDDDMCGEAAFSSYDVMLGE